MLCRFDSEVVNLSYMADALKELAYLPDRCQLTPRFLHFQRGCIHEHAY
jgi:hypothetical protein